LDWAFLVGIAGLAHELVEASLATLLAVRTIAAIGAIVDAHTGADAMDAGAGVADVAAGAAIGAIRQQIAAGFIAGRFADWAEATGNRATRSECDGAETADWTIIVGLALRGVVETGEARLASLRAGFARRAALGAFVIGRADAGAMHADSARAFDAANAAVGRISLNVDATLTAVNLTRWARAAPAHADLARCAAIPATAAIASVALEIDALLAALFLTALALLLSPFSFPGLCRSGNRGSEQTERGAKPSQEATARWGCDQ
jgi:hypothetical protein